MSRRVLIAFLALLLPGGVVPPDVEARLALAAPPRAFVSNLHTAPTIVRQAARVAGDEVAARPASGILIVTLRRPAAITDTGEDTVATLPDSLVWRTFGLRAPPPA